MSDLVPLCYFLEIEVSANSDGFFSSQEKYIHDLAHVALNDKVTVDTPMELDVHLCASDGEPLFDLTH